MRLLLDTHTLLWFLLTNEKLSLRARAEISNANNTVFASAVSAMEISTKHRIGKLSEALSLATDFARIVYEEGFDGLPISLEHARLAGSFQHPHRDPFDRLLIAQAIVDDLHLVSNETIFDGFGVKRLW